MSLRRMVWDRRVPQVVLAALVCGVALSGVAQAVPAPGGGPTAGGTRVGDHLPAGVVLTAISSGNGHSLAVGSDGNTYAWGDNAYGQLGDGTNTGSLLPVRVQTPADVTFTSVAAGGIHSLAVGSDGNTYAWGWNGEGQLGDGTTQDARLPVRVDVPQGVTFTSVSGGQIHSLAVGSDGQAYAWGSNRYGLLGSTSPASSPTPVLVAVPTGVTFTSVSAGVEHSLAVGSDGHAYSWGYNGSGQLGYGRSIQHSRVPVRVQAPAGVTFTSVSAGTGHSLAVSSDGTTYAWGNGDSGQLGTESEDDNYVPLRVDVPQGVTFTGVSAGREHSLAIGSDGNTYAWGDDFFGQLGSGGTTNSPVPVQVRAPAGVTFTGVAAGDYHSLALGSDGNAYAWGWNDVGQLGDGTDTDSPVPVMVRFVVVESVTFGGVEGTGLTQNGATWSVVTPAHECGVVDVTVTYTHSGVTSTQTTPGGFTFGTAPVVITSPASVTLPPGEHDVTLTAEGTGDPAAVHWQQSAEPGHWTDIPGATTTTLTTTVENTTDFRAAFTNCLGTATTRPATVTPTATPTPTPTPTPTGPPTPEPGTDTTPGTGAGTGPGGLATTGPSWPGPLAATALLLTGGAATLLARRHHRPTGR